MLRRRESCGKIRLYRIWINSRVYDDTNYELSKINPFRYKGYYYDEEINMYYVT
ncbi:MAG: hypothetical protein V8R16_02630 [Bacilli bacterium]